jgi:hypothetical protein
VACGAFLTRYPKSLTDTRLPSCHTHGMDENEELLKQLLEGMPPETRFRMQRFIRLVSERNECALAIIQRIESGRVSPTDALDALDRCLGARQ